MEILLDAGLATLLAATLFHAVRLERALGVLKRDRASLETLVASFNASTRAAESGIERLRVATDGAGRQVRRQIEGATALKDDLTFLVQRGEGLADRLDELVRAARPVADQARLHDPARLHVDEAARPHLAAVPGTYSPFAEAPAGPAEAGESRARSQAERDLLKALRMAR